MGGSVGVTVRCPDGKEYRMTRWTNILPYYIVNAGLVTKSKEHLDKFIGQWQEMREDYIKHRDDENFEFPMTTCYATDEDTVLAPSEYGIVVVDCVNDVILSSQHYCHVDDIHCVTLSNVPYDEDTIKRFENLHALHRIAGLKYYDTKTKEHRVMVLLGWTAKDILDRIELARERSFKDEKDPSDIPFLYGSLLVDMHPFTVFQYEHSFDSIKTVKEKILELGFELSAEEERLWEEYIKNLEE